jgi:hypothetical protein
VDISSFEDLVRAAHLQPDPQRLLFVFTKAALPKHAAGDEIRRFQSGVGGALQPLMNVDKRPEDLGSFAALAAEADAIERGWSIVFVACLAGRGAIAPGTAETERSIEMMVSAIQNGGDISRYLAFDRNGELLSISLE